MTDLIKHFGFTDPRRHVVARVTWVYVLCGTYLAFVVTVSKFAPENSGVDFRPSLTASSAQGLLTLIASLVASLFVATLTISLNRGPEPQMASTFLPAASVLMEVLALLAASIGLLQFFTADGPGALSASTILRAVASVVLVSLALIGASTIPAGHLREHEDALADRRRARAVRAIDGLARRPGSGRSTLLWLAAQGLVPAAVLAAGLFVSSSTDVLRTAIIVAVLFALSGIACLGLLAAVSWGNYLLASTMTGFIFNAFLASAVPAVDGVRDLRGLAAIGVAYGGAVIAWLTITYAAVVRARSGQRAGLLRALRMLKTPLRDERRNGEDISPSRTPSAISQLLGFAAISGRDSRGR